MKSFSVPEDVGVALRPAFSLYCSDPDALAVFNKYWQEINIAQTELNNAKDGLRDCYNAFEMQRRVRVLQQYTNRLSKVGEEILLDWLQLGNVSVVQSAQIKGHYLEVMAQSYSDTTKCITVRYGQLEADSHVTYSVEFYIFDKRTP